MGPLQTELRGLRYRLAHVEAQIDQGEAAFCSHGGCCPNCAIPGFSVLVSAATRKKQRIQQLEQRLKVDSMTRKEKRDRILFEQAMRQTIIDYQCGPGDRSAVYFDARSSPLAVSTPSNIATFVQGLNGELRIQNVTVVDNRGFQLHRFNLDFEFRKEQGLSWLRQALTQSEDQLIDRLGPGRAAVEFYTTGWTPEKIGDQVWRIRSIAALLRYNFKAPHHD